MDQERQQSERDSNGVPTEYVCREITVVFKE
jgi:hypothetical protein